jgi:hypothetical protein
MKQAASKAGLSLGEIQGGEQLIFSLDLRERIEEIKADLERGSTPGLSISQRSEEIRAGLEEGSTPFNFYIDLATAKLWALTKDAPDDKLLEEELVETHPLLNGVAERLKQNLFQLQDLFSRRKALDRGEQTGDNKADLENQIVAALVLAKEEVWALYQVTDCHYLKYRKDNPTAREIMLRDCNTVSFAIPRPTEFLSISIAETIIFRTLQAYDGSTGLPIGNLQDGRTSLFFFSEQSAYHPSFIYYPDGAYQGINLIDPLFRVPAEKKGK